MRRAGSWLALPALLCLGLASGATVGLDAYTLSEETLTRWRLPERLREISGLATLDGRLFGHGDELGIIYEIDPSHGRFVKAFALGGATVHDDFEGIAVAGDRFYLVASSGRLYESLEGADGERVLYNTYGTGIGRDCDVEGLAFEPADRSLLLLCKTPRPDGFVRIHHWSLERRTLSENAPLLISVATLADGIGGDSFHPSGIERHPDTGHYFVVAARESALAEVTPDGEVVSVRALPRRHRQPEGIALLSDDVLALADEGARGRAHLTLYRPRLEQASRVPPH